ncbi:chorion class A protein L11-like [Rhineura floridana]|uniref:chorion class A protein L11-like n=1 Tax=Rhineura floridana TaxID=261503 RepID=UPI002AC838CF|nr:chorion class A protein L11-like [Rhineura floridana]
MEGGSRISGKKGRGPLSPPSIHDSSPSLNMSGCWSYCEPTCAIPSCASAPTIGLGPCGVGGYGGGYGGSIGSGYGGGVGGGRLVGGGGVPASSLGIYPGANVGCISQVPPAEVVIQPPSFTVTVPGPILSASCDPVSVGGYTPCADGYYGSGYPYRGYLGGGYKGSGRSKRVCGYPC